MKTGFFTSEFFTAIIGSVATIVGVPVQASITAITYILERTILKKNTTDTSNLKKGFLTSEFWATLIITNLSIFFPDLPKESFYPVIAYIFSRFIIKKKELKNDTDTGTN